MPCLVNLPHQKPPSASKQVDEISQSTSSKSDRAQKQTREGQVHDALTKSDHRVEEEIDEKRELAQSLNTDSVQPDIKQTQTFHATDTSKITSDTMIAEMSRDSQKKLETKSDTRTYTQDVTHLNKDQQLREEERFLLAKIHQMTRDRSPASDHHSMKLLVPDPHDMLYNTAGLFDHCEPRVFHSLDTIEEISLSEEDELDDDPPQSQEEEKDV